MATEAHDSNIVEAAAISDSDAAAKNNDNSNNVAPNPTSVKGPATSVSPEEISNKHITDIVDELVTSAEPSVSGGSDTETSRLKSKNGEAEHVRTSSTARKHTTFKAVSVNKTFLAAKATAATAPKAGDKASPTLGTATLSASSSASARPRLVAKTGGLVAKGSGGANGRPAAAPDANAVWNKNRPAPPPEPTKLTDEDLKKYGIHVASRLQQDESKGGEANWADIDDDDEDWAPEEITWTDGTKSTIPHHEEHNEPPPQPATAESSIMARLHPSGSLAASLHNRDGNALGKPKSPAPGADQPPVRHSGLPSGKGLILKGAPEKPTLVAKPPAPPMPVKSPWGALPPVDKTPLMPMETQHGMGPGRMQHHQPYQSYQRDGYGPPSHGMPPPPFKEIAADDFSRGGFRDGHPHTNRELFNSQSGRLEPVQDRRGGQRSDGNYRQAPGTTLLQRPSSMSDQPEPSAAFQTHRTSAEIGPYGRRRGSSNVSGGSVGFMQRLGRPGDQHAPPELLSARRSSVTGRSESPVSPRNFSPSGSRSWSRPSPSPAYAAPYTNGPPAAPASVTSIDDELEMQKKIMRERRELAKKRRLEEEEREDAARRERIRLKLEALGPAPERKSAKKEAAKEGALAPAAPAATSTAGAPASETSNKVASESPQTSHAATDSSPHPSDGKRQQQTWQSPAATQSDRLSSWGSAGQGATRNLWASPNSNRSLGNGTTFVTEPYTPAVSQIASSKQGPGPIGPPASQKSATTPPTAPIAPIGPPKATAVTAAPVASAVLQAAGPANSASSVRSAWTSAVKASDENLLAQQKARQAEQQREAEARGLSLNDLRPAIKDTWMPTRMNEDGDRIEDKAKRSVMHRPGNTAPAGAVSGSASLPAQQSRPSRFFPPRDAHQGDSNSEHTAGTSGSAEGGHGRPGSPSPPPPDMDGHPAFDGDAAHPHVSLPRPQIVVRLPPKGTGPAAATWHHPQHHGHPQLSASHWAPHQPSTTDDSSWQAKFDHLFERKPVSPSKPTANKGKADEPVPAPQQQRPATAVPIASAAQATRRAANNGRRAPEEPVVSRMMAEECFERQEMGSLPSVHLPNKAPELAWTPAAAPKPLPRRFAVSTVTGVDHDAFSRESFGAPYIVSVRMPGAGGSAKDMHLPLPRTQSNPRRPNRGRHGGGGGSGGGGGGGGGQRGNNRTRDTASSHSGSHGNNGDHGTPPGSSHGPSGGGGGRNRSSGLRHRSEHWTRSSPASVQT